MNNGEHFNAHSPPNIFKLTVITSCRARTRAITRVNTYTVTNNITLHTIQQHLINLV